MPIAAEVIPRWMLIAAVLLFFGTMLSRRLKALRKKATEKKPLQRNNG